ncbi:tetratricopeptide repeat protein [Tenacibaculum sp. IB213877]|uniref:tetratricopeptide repeat protein n=1 Tax=Tenacibaculum sp. IB213877 TaxID=3097351 RepID=UPI002A5ADAAF|nr:tetratricopeptide repeat protein [Tenacibaculum sp. IB213877]MDY0780022.1 tetratricopeptide repeat protein [Tenacibaculum sp. IB213877]
MLKTNNIFFFDATEFEQIIQHYLNIGKLSLAKKATQLGLDQHPASIELKLLKVEIYVFEDNLEKAVELLNEIEAVEPHNDEVYIQKASILSKNSKHKEAVLILKESLKFVQDPVDVWAMIGMEYMYMDDYENARLNFAKCIDVDYEDYSSLYNIVYCFEMQEKQEEAIRFLNAYVDKNPYSEVAWHQLGRQYFELEMYKEALTSFDYAVLIDEGFLGGYIEKAKTLEELGRFEEAIENYLITLELDDPTAFAYIRIGECFNELNDTKAAIKYFKKAVNEDPLLDKGWVILTDAYLDQENHHKALYYITKALQIDDSNPIYWRKYANINVKLSFFDEATKALERCIDLGDVDIDIYIALADVLLLLGNYEYALKVLVKGKKIYREFAEIEYRLCGLFMILNKQDYSIMHLKNAIAIDFEYHQVVKELYPKVFETEAVKKTITNYQKAIK